MSASSTAIKSAVQVCVRTRPTANFAAENLRIDAASNAIAVHIPRAPNQHINNQQEDWQFQFDHILHNSTQEAVYDTCAKDIVDSVLQGYNGTIMAYGQTGAGKTFTMSGGSSSYKYRGVIPRAISHVFHHIEQHTEHAFTVRCSYLEIYNETFFDLLRDQRRSADGSVEASNDAANPTVSGAAVLSDLAVLEDANGMVVVKDLTSIVCANEEDALNLLFAGDTNRAIAQHQLNQQSSRSHCIFTVHIESQSRVESSEKRVVSKLNLVDLAGSERVGKTGSQGAILQEAKYINKSLTFLEQVVLALSSKNRDHYPFRSSKLTNVLRDSLGGNCKTRLIANVWGEREQLEETISTLKFATRMMRVTTEAKVNVQIDPALLVVRYEREIKELKQELSMLNTLANRGAVSYEDYTPEESFEIQQTVQRYVHGDIDLNDLQLDSLRQIRELLRQFKIYAQHTYAPAASSPVIPTKAATVTPAIGNQSAPAAAASSAQQLPARSSSRAGAQSQMMVGDLDDATGGFSVGQAAPDARPPTSATVAAPKAGARSSSPVAGSSTSPMSPTPVNKQPAVERSSSVAPQSVTPTSTAPVSAPVSVAAPTQPQQPAISEAQAFEDYKKTDGAALDRVYNDNKETVKQKKQLLQKQSLEVNEIKRNIDRVSESLQVKRQQREIVESLQQAAGATDSTVPAGAKVLDEAEYALLRELKQLKKDYQTKFEARKQTHTEVTYVEGLVTQSKLNLARSFLDWWQEHPANAARQISSTLGTFNESSSSSPAVTFEPKISSGADSRKKGTEASPRSANDVSDDTGVSLDDGEAFEQMELQRIAANDPEALSFYNARKTVRTAQKQRKAPLVDVHSRAKGRAH